MIGPVEVRTDVAGAVGLPGPVTTAASVFLPDPPSPGSPGVASPPVVVFAFPGAGYGRGYFSFDLPGWSGSGQAGHHADRQGWVVVTCDHLGVGDSTVPEGTDLTLDQLCAANRATVEHVTGLLAAGTLAEGYPPVRAPVRIGMGQSMGGGLTVALQGRAPVFDGLAVLGFSAIQTVLPVPDGPGRTVEASEGTEALPGPEDTGLFDILRYGFHFRDEPPDVVDRDMVDFPTRGGDLPPWASATIPGLVVAMTAPGVVATEAAAVDVPVFVGVGEIDVVPDPRAEPGAYPASPDVTVHVAPGMAHMHNFAGTRARWWERIGAWGRGVGRRADGIPG